MRRMKRSCPLALCLVLVLAASTALAARGLEEPAGLAKVVKGARRSDVSDALARPGMAEGCKDALEQRDLFGLGCRAALAGALVRGRALEKAPELAARKSLLADLSRAADAIASYAPLDPPPGFGRARFDALAAVGRELMATHDELAALPATHALGAPIAAFLAERPGPKQAACAGVQRALDAAGAAGATIEESGPLLGLVTSHRCLVDEDRLVSRPKPAALQNNEDAKRVAAASSVDAAIADYLSTRALELERCKKHFDATGRAVDEEKARACVCGAVSRWRFPPRVAGQTGTIPFQRARVTVQLDANGAVAQCGPLSAAP